MPGIGRRSTVLHVTLVQSLLDRHLLDSKGALSFSPLCSGMIRDLAALLPSPGYFGFYVGASFFNL